jgi:hypothetical protein
MEIMGSENTKSTDIIQNLIVLGLIKAVLTG